MSISEGTGIGKRLLWKTDRKDLRDNGRPVRPLDGVGEGAHFERLGAEADGGHRQEQRHVLVSDAKPKS